MSYWQLIKSYFSPKKEKSLIQTIPKGVDDLIKSYIFTPTVDIWSQYKCSSCLYRSEALNQTCKGCGCNFYQMDISLLVNYPYQNKACFTFDLLFDYSFEFNKLLTLGMERLEKNDLSPLEIKAVDEKKFTKWIVILDENITLKNECAELSLQRIHGNKVFQCFTHVRNFNNAKIIEHIFNKSVYVELINDVYVSITSPYAPNSPDNLEMKINTSTKTIDVLQYQQEHASYKIQQGMISYEELVNQGVTSNKFAIINTNTAYYSEYHIPAAQLDHLKQSYETHPFDLTKLCGTFEFKTHLCIQ